MDTSDTDTECRCATCFHLCVLGADFCGEKCAREFDAWFAAAREAEKQAPRLTLVAS